MLHQDCIWIEFVFEFFMKRDSFLNFPRLLMCGFTGCHQSLRNIFHSYNRQSMCINKVEKMLWLSERFLSMYASNTGYVFMLFLPFPPAVAVHSVAFVRIMVTCHTAKRKTPKHSALYTDGVWRWWRFQNLLLHPLPFSLPFYFSLGFLGFSHNLQAL